MQKSAVRKVKPRHKSRCAPRLHLLPARTLEARLLHLARDRLRKERCFKWPQVALTTKTNSHMGLKRVSLSQQFGKLTAAVRDAEASWPVDRPEDHGTVGAAYCESALRKPQLRRKHCDASPQSPSPSRPYTCSSLPPNKGNFLRG